MTVTAAEKNNADASGRHEGLVRAQFVKQSEEWIRRVASAFSEESLAAAMANPGSSDTMMRLMKSRDDLDPIHGALFLRACLAVERIVRGMPGDLLVSALAAPSDYGALARALGDPRVAAPSREIDPLAGAISRSIASREALARAAGELLSSTRVSTILGIKRQAIDKRRSAGKILAVRQGSDWAYPAFQFGSDHVLPGMKAVLDAHLGMDPWALIDILLAPDERLGGRRLLDAIREGDEAFLRRHVDQTNGDGYA